MKITRLIAASALALAVTVAQPVTAGALQTMAPAASSSTNMALPVAWGVGFFLCTGMTWGKMQVDAKKAHRELTGADAFRGIARCLFPPIGFAKLMKESK